MKVAHIAFECSPIYKTGGLGDVVGSLPKELQRLGVESVVVMPKYGWIDRPKNLPGSDVAVFYADSPYFHKPNTAHDPKITAPTFAHFAKLALEELKRQKFQPDIIHCHDWHTGLVPLILKKRPDSFFEKTKSIITLHNIAFQGVFPLKYLDTPLTKNMPHLFNGHAKRVSYLKEGIRFADFVTTVSPYHAREIRRGSVSFGFKQLIGKKRGKFIGILNGLDYRFWNPRQDKFIFDKYNLNSVKTGKSDNKIKLQRELGLEESADIPMFAFIARLSNQKGIELMMPLVENAGKKRLQVVILGKGDGKYTRMLLESAKKTELKKWISINIGFNEKLAHRIYASTDFFLIPSLYEPCGLTQMIAMRYGSIPIASAVGGLKDSIENGKNGWLFDEHSTDAFNRKVELALGLWEEPEKLASMMMRCLHKDFSWRRSAKAYLRVYNKLLKGFR